MIGNALRMIAGTAGNDPIGALLLRQGLQFGQCASGLEGIGMLKILEFEENIEPQVQ